jgi:hypothetical protein
MATPGNFSFRGLTPTGWTASSVVGPVNALGQKSASAADLLTPGGYARDRKLASRSFMNPNTGIRSPAISASVYRQPNMPAYLTQAVERLNMEQGLRRSLQSEWNNRILQAAATPGPNQYLWMEAARAASVSPGTAVTFSKAVQNPAIGEGYKAMATEQANVEKQRLANLTRASNLQRQLEGMPQDAPGRAEIMLQIRDAQELAKGLPSSATNPGAAASRPPPTTTTAKKAPFFWQPPQQSPSGWTPNSWAPRPLTF